jgi:tRNA threonylcarbamoyladenosine biosynthesis protein TsaB
VRVLAVDTTSARASVALLDGAELLGEVRLVSEAGHSRTVLPAAAFLLETAGLAPAAIEGFAVTTGPGSFTGIRVGLSSVQGLALPGSRPCLGVSTLEVLGARAQGAAPMVAPIVDAWRGEIYVAVYDASGRTVAEPRAAAPEAALAELPPGPVAFIGDGALRYRPLIEAARPDAVFPSRSLFLAATLGRLAEPRLRAGEGVGPEALRPLYLRAPQIRRASA